MKKLPDLLDENLVNENNKDNHISNISKSDEFVIDADIDILTKLLKIKNKVYDDYYQKMWNTYDGGDEGEIFLRFSELKGGLGHYTGYKNSNLKTKDLFKTFISNNDVLEDRKMIVEEDTSKTNTKEEEVKNAIKDYLSFNLKNKEVKEEECEEEVKEEECEEEVEKNHKNEKKRNQT